MIFTTSSKYVLRPFKNGQDAQWIWDQVKRVTKEDPQQLWLFIEFGETTPMATCQHSTSQWAGPGLVDKI